MKDFSLGVGNMKKIIELMIIIVLLLTMTQISTVGIDPTDDKQEFTALENEMIKINDRLLTAKTLDEKESIIWELALLLEKYGVLPGDITIDETYELMKKSFIEKEQFEYQLIGPPGWEFLHPLAWIIGFQLLGHSYTEEPFNSLKISIKSISGQLLFLFGPFRMYYDKSNCKFTYLYIPYGWGKIRITLKWNWKGEEYQDIFDGALDGFKVSPI